MITVNLFENIFGGSEYSVVDQVPENVRYTRRQMKYEGVTLFVDNTINDPLVRDVKSTYKIGWLREPRCLHPETYEGAIENVDKFDFILTYDQDLIALDPHRFRFVPYGGIWISKSEWSIHPKRKNVSMLFGEKKATRGHQLRHEIYDAIGDNYGIDYYGYHGTPTDYGPHTKLQVLKDYRYSIVIETCREEGLFTEILLDCFAVGTIPIFWGAPDIGNYFNARGILSFSNINELKYILNSLGYPGNGLRHSPDLYGNRYYAREYRRMLPYIGINHIAMKKYAITEDWLYQRYFADWKLEDWLGR